MYTLHPTNLEIVHVTWVCLDGPIDQRWVESLSGALDTGGSHPTPYILNPTPYTMHPTSYTLHSSSRVALGRPRHGRVTPYTLHP